MSNKAEVTTTKTWTLTGWKAALIKDIADDTVAWFVTLLVGAVCGCLCTLLTLALIAKGT